jgi:hypothetical protein
MHEGKKALLRALELCEWRRRERLYAELDAAQGEVRFGPGASQFRWKGPTRFQKGSENCDAAVEGVIFRLFRMADFGMGPKARLFVVCPMCAQEVPIGRLHQHAAVHVVGHGGPGFTIRSDRWVVDFDGEFKPCSRSDERVAFV